jgi:hypothetical protein
VIYCKVIMIDSASGIFADDKGIDEITSTVVIRSERLPRVSPGAKRNASKARFSFWPKPYYV